jgi:hypothetical protein
VTGVEDFWRFKDLVAFVLDVQVNLMEVSQINKSCAISGGVIISVGGKE